MQNYLCLFVIFLQIILNFCPNAFSDTNQLPESFTKQITYKPFSTELIENSDIQKAIQQLHELNSKKTVEGWTLYQLIEYMDSGSFKGFIVTYKKLENNYSSN